jgi:hypothetical protein
MGAFSSKECAWAQVSVKLLGRTIIGLRGFEFKKTVEKEALYGAGDEPIDIQTGNKKYEGNLKLLKHEVDLLNDAALAAGYADITEVPHSVVMITCMYKKTPADVSRVITATGVAFTEVGSSMEQGGKMTEVTLPWIAIGMVNK